MWSQWRLIQYRPEDFRAIRAAVTSVPESPVASLFAGLRVVSRGGYLPRTRVTRRERVVRCNKAMKRVAVVGSGGSGKSTFARSLGTATHLPVIHLDEFYWRPGWVETPRDEWRTVQSAMVARDEWIIEGNYRNTYDIRFNRADTVIVLAPPRHICIYRALKRVITNWHQPTQAPGCPEHFDWSFIVWLWRFPSDARPALDEALAQYRGRFDLVELTTRRAVREYLSAAP